MSEFDDLFNEFFDPENSKKKPENDDDDDSINDEAQKIIDMINNFRLNPDEFDKEKIDEQLEEKLGEPDSIEYGREGEYYIERRIWHKESGMIIKTLMSDTPFDDVPTIGVELSLNEQLDKAVADENYELAAAIRDKIKKDIAKQKRLAKKLLKESPDYQVIEKKDEKK